MSDRNHKIIAACEDRIDDGAFTSQLTLTLERGDEPLGLESIKLMSGGFNEEIIGVFTG